MEAKTQTEMQAIIEEYFVANPAICWETGCKDAWRVGNKKYVYKPSSKGFALQYDGKRLGVATTVEQIRGFLNTDYDKEMGVKAPSPSATVGVHAKIVAKKETTVKNVLLSPAMVNPPKPKQSGPTANDREKCKQLGIANPDELYARGAINFYKSLAVARPDYRSKHDSKNEWIDAYVERLGAKLAPFISTPTAPVAIEANTIFDRLKNGEKLELVEFRLLQKAGLL